MALSSERRIKPLEEPLSMTQLEEAGDNVMESFRQDMRELGLNLEVFENRMWNMLRIPFPRIALPRWEEGVLPLTDVEETPTNYLVRMNLPGVPKDKVEIRFWDQNLDLKADVMTHKETERKNYVYRERTETGYHRRLNFPTPIVADKTEAVLENGILTVTVPKLKTAEEKRIRVR